MSRIFCKENCLSQPLSLSQRKGEGGEPCTTFLLPFSDRDPERTNQREVKNDDKTFLKGALLKNNFFRLHQIVLNVSPPGLAQDAEPRQAENIISIQISNVSVPGAWAWAWSQSVPLSSLGEDP